MECYSPYIIGFEDGVVLGVMTMFLLVLLIECMNGPARYKRT
jgi:hypothetical protein